MKEAGGSLKINTVHSCKAQIAAKNGFQAAYENMERQPESPRLQFDEAQMLVGSIMDERGAGYAPYSVIPNHHVEAA